MPRSPLLEMDDDPLSGTLDEHSGRAKPPLSRDIDNVVHDDDKAIQQEKSAQQEPWDRDVFASHPSSIATSKPLPIVIRDIVQQHDPEATPTALNAFPQQHLTAADTRTSMRESDANGDMYAHDAEAGTVVQNEESGSSDDGNMAAQSADLHMVGNEPVASTSTPTKARKKSTLISVLRTRVCKAASKGDLDALLAILHPSPRLGGASGEDSNTDHNNSDYDDDDVEDYPSSFALVNSPTASGLTPLLEAASKGHLHVVRHLVEEEGAVRDLEDLEGENAFLKASYRGHLHVMKYLAGSSGDHGQDLDEQGTSVNAADREGWTALHNACTKGFLEVVMWLSENGADIDAQSVQGYTPLMNAASKGHLPIVKYLLTRHAPDLFLRNAYQETAYDVAVATYELGIADILASHEAKLWASTSSSQGGHLKPYNPLGMHVTVPVIVYENQRLDLRWFTRAKRSLSTGAGSVSSPIAAVGGAHHPDIKFTSSALSRRDGHASSELPPTYEGLNGSGRWIPVRRSEIGLPCVAEPRQLRLPATAAASGKRPSPQRNSEADQDTRPQSSSSSSGSTHPQQQQQQQQAVSHSSTGTNEAAWLWLSESFFVDLSPATIDPDQGWQYASSFDEPEENWSAQMPLEVVRILGGGGDVPSSGKTKWVRRRRWARIMRRRFDLPHWGFDDDPESTTENAQDADSRVDGERGRQLEQLAPVQDYLERAQYFAGSSRILKQSRVAGGSSDQDGQRSHEGAKDDDDASVRSLRTVIGGSSSDETVDHAAGRKVVARLDRALRELREGMQDDTDEVRKLQADTLVGIFQERLEELKREHPQADLDTEDAESFKYPGADDESDLDDAASVSTSLRSASVYSPRTRSPAGPRQSISSVSGSPAARQHPPPRPDVSRQLSSNPDFRIPTHEMPRLANVPHLSARSQASAHVGSSSSSRPARSSTPWEPDDSTSECRRCQRKFTFFLRKHHCRKCGLVVCAHCSSHNDYLRSHQVVHEPWTSTNDLDPVYLIQQLEGGGFYRTCDTCHQALRTEAATIDPDLLLGPLHRLQTASSPESDAALSLAPSTGDAHAAGSPMQRSVSDMSDLGECPVCGTDLEQFSDKAAQEQHVQTCLESGTSSRLQDNRYLVFTLPDTSPLVDTDCLICFESYEAEDHIGRLSCLCHFHKHCIANWLSRGKSCPVHAP